jgi:hypothetical protein
MTFPLLPVAPVLLAVGLIAGCSGLGGSGVTTAGGRSASAAATSPDPAGSAAAASGAPEPFGAAGTAGVPAQPGCARWPAGSAGPVLLVTAASGGKTYCVRTGQVVRVPLSGPAALPGGSDPPRLTGDALAAAPAHLLRTPSVTYTAVRPGTAVLTIVGLPCRVIQPAQGAAASARRGALARAASAPAAETAYRAWSAPVAGAARAAPVGGTPAGAECETQQALRVSIVVR